MDYQNQSINHTQTNQLQVHNPLSGILGAKNVLGIQSSLNTIKVTECICHVLNIPRRVWSSRPQSYTLVFL